MPHPTDVHVGGRLREIRIMRGLTQTELGNKLGISFQQVQKYEKGSNRIGSSRLWNICRILDVPVSFFFEGLEGAGAASELSRKTIQLAKELESIGDDDLKATFIKLIRAYSK